MKKKHVILIIILMLSAGAGYYGYKEFTREHESLNETKADIAMPSSELIAAFTNDENKANAQFLDKIISVRGVVKSVQKDDKGLYTVFLGSEGEMSSVSCQVDDKESATVQNLKPGDKVTFKGVCTGMLMDVVLIRCVLQK
ncbi:MAG: OB-fold putative lipoprotein [Bacteroidia bacterium]|nr:OB-fold putative lipoprotein [Bacteroidia bacterium]